MTHSELPSPGQPVCVRTADSRKFAIHVLPEVMRRLSAESWAASQGSLGRPIEPCGILLGSTDSTEHAITFTVEEFQPVEAARLQEAILRNGGSSVGIYLSRKRSRAPVLEDADVELFERCFPAGHALFLIISALRGVAAAFVPIEGTLKCVSEFALASSLAVRRPDRQHPSPQGSKASTRIRPGKWVLAALVAILALAAAIRVPFHRSSTPALRPGENLRLTVESHGSSLRLLWDPTSAGLHTAARVILHLQDGDNRTDRDLSPSEISAGSFLYEPKTSAVTFRLDVYSTAPNASALVEAMNPAMNQARGLDQVQAAPSQPPIQPKLDALPVRTPPFPVQPPVARTEAASSRSRCAFGRL